MSDVNSESIQGGEVEGEGHRDPVVIEPQLPASQVDTEKLHEEIRQLKEKLEKSEEDKRNLKAGLWKAQEELKTKDVKVREFRDTKVAVKGLYGVARAVLSALLGEKEPPNRNYKVVNVKVITKLCHDLQEKFSEWGRSHDLLHDKMEEILFVASDLDAKLAPYFTERRDLLANQAIPGPSTSVSLLRDILEGDASNEAPTGQKKKKVPKRKLSTSLKAIRRGPSSSSIIFRRLRRNPVRACRLQSSPPRAYPPAPQRVRRAKPAQFTCTRCRSTYTRLEHICTRLEPMKNQELIPNREVAGSSMETDAEVGGSSWETDVEMPGPPAQERGQELPENDKDETEEQAPNPSDPFLKPGPLVVMDPTGQEHRFAGSRKTILPSEQKRSIVEGTPPVKEVRQFCKCGKNFQNSTALFSHIKFMAKGNIGNNPTCGMCKQAFDWKGGLQTHLRAMHGVEYCRGRFVCLECGEEFRTNTEILNHQMKIHGKETKGENENENE